MSPFSLGSFSLTLSSLLEPILKGLHEWMLFDVGGGNNENITDLIFD